MEGATAGSQAKDAEAARAGAREPEGKTYPMVRVEDITDDGPEKVVALFLDAWKRKSWVEMVASTRPGWRSEEKSPEEKLKSWFGTFDLRGASIESLAIRGYVGQVECKVHYGVGSSVKSYSTSVRVVHEDATGRRWKGGAWGVDPVLTFREEP